MEKLRHAASLLKIILEREYFVIPSHAFGKYLNFINRNLSNMRLPEWFRPSAWGAVFGAAALAVVGFSYFGWVLGGTAERMAVARAAAAVVAGLAPVCVDRFRHGPDAATQLVHLRQTSSWQRSDFIERGGWATLPGNDRPNSAVATACADILAS
jgi:hypothetical protein